MRRLHPVFNVVKLTPAPANLITGSQPNLPPPPELVEGEEEYLVEEILDSKKHNTWEYATDVHVPKCLAEFYLLPKAPGSTTPNPSRNFLFHFFPVSTHLLRVEAVLKGGVVVRGLPSHLPKPFPTSCCRSLLLLLPRALPE
jgi:hypothetical protein